MCVLKLISCYGPHNFVPERQETFACEDHPQIVRSMRDNWVGHYVPCRLNGSMCSLDTYYVYVALKVFGILNFFLQHKLKYNVVKYHIVMEKYHISPKE